MFKKLILSLFVCSFAVGSWLLLKNRTQKADDVLILGTMSGWPPFVSINNQGAYEGFDIDIANEIARRLNKKLVIEDMDTAALITALEQGKVDFIMTGLDITPARLAKIAMIPYQGEPITEFPLLFWKEVPQGIKSLEDLKNSNKVICVEAGSSQEEFLSQYKGFEIKNVDPLAAVLELKYGRALAVLLETKLYRELKKKYPELTALMIPLDEKNILLGCGIGVKKSNTELIKKITAIIDDLKKNGFLQEREKRWFSKEPS